MEKRNLEEGGVGKNEDRLWRAMYAVQDHLTEITDKRYNNRREQVLAVIYVFVDGLQLLALCLGRQSSFDTGVTRPIIKWLDLHILFTQHSYAQFTNVLWAYFVAFLVAIVGFFYRVFRLSKGKPARSVQIYSTMISRAILFALFIPFVKLFVSVFACGQDDWLGEGRPGLVACLSLTWTVYAAIAGAALGLFVPISMMYFFLFRHSHIGCPDFESRPHGHFHAPYALGRLVMIAATAATPGESVIVQLIFLACTGLPLAFLLKTLPTYRRFMNYIRAGFLAAAFQLSVASLISSGVGVQGDPQRVLATSVLIALAGLAFAAGMGAVWFSYWRIDRLAATEAPEFESPYVAELCARSILEREHTEEQKQKAEALIRAGIEQFPTAAYIQLQYAHYLKSFGNNGNAAAQEVRNCWRKEPAIDFRYEAHSTRLFWERQAQLHGGGSGAGAAADLFSSADNKRMYDKARQGHTKTLKLIRTFWIALAKKNLHVAGAIDDVPRRLADIDAQSKDAEAAYVTLLKRFSSSKILLRAYASFLEQCMNDKPKSQLYYMKADEVEENESKTASLSQSQSQSQSQSAGGGGAGASQSASESASSGASSSAAAKKRALSKELKLRSNETNAVTRLFWGVILGLLFLAAVSCSMFIVVKLLFVQYDQALNRLRTISFQRRRVVAVNNMVRWMHLGALENNTALFTKWAGEVGVRSKDFSYDHRGLYFGYDDKELPPSQEGGIKKFWGEPNVKILKYFPGPPLYETTEEQSIWDAGNAIMIACRRLSLMHGDDFRDIHSIKEARFVFQNALFGILDGFNAFTTLFEGELMATIEKAKWIILAVCMVAQMLLVGEALFVFRPSFKAVRSTMRGVSDILQGMPRALIKQTAKVYSKAHKRDKENDGASGSEDSHSGKSSGSEEGRRGSSSSEGGRDGSASEGSDGPRRKGKGRRRRPSKERERGADGDDIPELGEKSEAEHSEEEEEEKRRKHGSSKHRKSSSSSKKERKGRKGSRRESKGSESEEAPERPAEQAHARVKADPALEAVDEGRPPSGGSAGSTRKPAGGRGAPEPPPVVMTMKASLVDDGEDETRETTPSFRRIEPDAEVAAPAGGASDRSAQSRVLAHTLSAAEGEGEVRVTSAGRGEAREGALGGLGLELDDLLDAMRGREGAGGALKPGKKGRKYEAADDASDGSAGGSPAASSRRAPSAHSLQMQLRPPRRRSASLVEGGAAVSSGILRKPSMEDKGMREAAGKALAEEKEVKETDDEKKKKKKEKEGKAKKAKGGEEASAGPDVLTLLTRKYMVSFFLIGGIFIANFLICFFILDAGKNFAYEINLAGRRRSIAREVAFYARELYINDGIFLERGEIYRRLVKKTALFKEIHQGLKSGDPALLVYGADGRNKLLDGIMYTAPQCLRLASEKCTATRVEDMELVENGLDALVAGVLDLVVAIMQEATPDLLLTGQEDPAVVKVRNYDHLNSKNLGLMMEIDDGDLDDGLNRAATALVNEAIQSMSIIELIEALILTFNIVFLGVLYIYLFAPMLSRLREESGRTGQILRMLPKDVVIKCPHIHQYFVGIRGDMDDE